MVNVMVAENNPSVPTGKPVKRKIKGKKVLLITLPLLLVIMAGAFLYFRSLPKSCSDAVQQSNAARGKINNLQTLKSEYSNIASRSDSCKSKGASSSPSQADQFQFYYNKATIGYDAGKFSEAKQDAESALALSGKLSANDKKKIKNYDQMVKDLGYVRDGTY
jgi:hypothetical protein